MTDDYKVHYKENSPEETVQRLTAILERIGIEVEEEWSEASEIDTFSLRLNVKGTSIGTNGKGVSRAYARASAYAEFFERYQNNLLGSYVNLQGTVHSFYSAPDEKIFFTDEVIKQNDSLTAYFFSKREPRYTSIQDQAAQFETFIKTDLFKYDLRQQYVMLPFYSVKSQTVQYLPESLLLRYCGSNGMSAGNTLEEAMVQGLSEIFERTAQKRLFTEKPQLPDVPDEYIMRYPYVYERYKKLADDPHYHVMMKDCSFGGKYPVAALIIIEKNTGYYGVKLGCHPDFGIAMERTLTEAAQGNNISVYAKRGKLDFFNTNVDSIKNICNSYKVGSAQFPYQIFGIHPDYDFSMPIDVSGLSNGEILRSWVQKIVDDGYEVLIRDNSYFGFPACQIFIPGLSEVYGNEDIVFRAYNTRATISKVLVDPTAINMDNIRNIIATLHYFSDSVLENNMGSYVKSMSHFPCSDFGGDCEFFTALCYAFMDKFAEAGREMQSVLKKASNRKSNPLELSFCQALLYYFSGMAIMKEHEAVMEWIGIMFDSEICGKINWLLGDKQNVFIKLYRAYIDEKLGMDTKNATVHLITQLRKAQFDSNVRQDKLRDYFDGSDVENKTGKEV